MWRNVTDRVFRNLLNFFNFQCKDLILENNVTKKIYITKYKDYIAKGIKNEAFNSFFEYLIEFVDKFDHISNNFRYYSMFAEKKDKKWYTKYKSNKNHLDDLCELLDSNKDSVLFILLPEINIISNEKQEETNSRNEPNSFFAKIDFLVRYLILKTDFIKKEYWELGDNLTADKILEDIFHLRSMLFLGYVSGENYKKEEKYSFIMLYLTFLNIYDPTTGRMFRNFIFLEDNYFDLNIKGIVEDQVFKIGCKKVKNIFLKVSNLKSTNFDLLTNENYLKTFDEENFCKEILKKCEEV